MFGGLKRGIITLKANDPYLSNLISEEKDAIAAIKQAHQSNAQAAKYLSLWGEQEFADLKDITSQYNQMTNEYTMMMAEWEYAQHEFREKLKDIRTHSDTIAAIRSKSKAAADKLLKAQKAGKPTEELSIESRALEAQLNNEMAAFETTKRNYLQQGMLAHFNGMKKFAQKLSEYATYGAELAHQIPQFSITPGQSPPTYEGTTH
jgi:chromosome segregation ATPase